MSSTTQSVQQTVVSAEGNALPVATCVNVHCTPFDRKSSTKTEVLPVPADTTVRQLKELLVARLDQNGATAITLFAGSASDATQNCSPLGEDTTVGAIAEAQQLSAGQPLTVLYTSETAYGCWFFCPCLLGLCVGCCCCS